MDREQMLDRFLEAMLPRSGDMTGPMAWSSIDEARRVADHAARDTRDRIARAQEFGDNGFQYGAA